MASRLRVASGRRKPHVELAARRLGVAQERLGARQGLAALQPRDGGLAGPHAGSQFGLRVEPRFAGIDDATPGLIVIVTNDYQKR